MKFFVILAGLSSVLLLSSGKQTESVYICVSPDAYAYHYNPRCTGLNRCTHEIKKVSKDEAIGTYRKRKLCGYED